MEKEQSILLRNVQGKIFICAENPWYQFLICKIKMCCKLDYMSLSRIRAYFLLIALEHNIVADILSLFGACYKEGLTNEFTFCRQLAHIPKHKSRCKLIYHEYLSSESDFSKAQTLIYGIPKDKSSL